MNERKAWKQFFEEVSRWRHHQRKWQRSPSCFNFLEFETFNRIYFIGVAEQVNDEGEKSFTGETLVFVDIPKSPDSGGGSPIRVRPADVFGNISRSGGGMLSRTEELRRERRRMGSATLTEYYFHEKTGILLIPVLSDVYLFADPLMAAEDKTGLVAEIFSPKPTTTTSPPPPTSSSVDPCSGEKAMDEDKGTTPTTTPYVIQLPNPNPNADQSDFKFCGPNPRLISYISTNSICLFDIPNNREVVLASYGVPDLACGVPSYVIQEEFNRMTGYHWCPDRSIDDQGGGGGGSKKETYFLLYEVTDERHVDFVALPTNPTPHDMYAEPTKYPRSGRDNSVSSLHILSISYDLEAKQLSPPFSL